MKNLKILTLLSSIASILIGCTDSGLDKTTMAPEQPTLKSTTQKNLVLDAEGKPSIKYLRNEFEMTGTGESEASACKNASSKANDNCPYTAKRISDVYEVKWRDSSLFDESKHWECRATFICETKSNAPE